MSNVFVSHRSSDAVLAERLATDIRAAGHTVWLDLWNISLGDSLIERIDAGLEGASFLVMLLSDDGVHSPWMGREWMSALARQLNDRSIKILPVKASSAQPPAILADVKYADAGADYNGALRSLLDAIR